ncbi:hypothetical protein pipiens_020003, partial [Culex pipiens pipiens]
DHYDCPLLFPSGALLGIGELRIFPGGPPLNPPGCIGTPGKTGFGSGGGVYSRAESSFRGRMDASRVKVDYPALPEEVVAKWYFNRQSKPHLDEHT